MTLENVLKLKEVFGGEPFQGVANDYFLVVMREDGHMITFAEDCVAEFDSPEAFYDAEDWTPAREISLWVVDE